MTTDTNIRHVNVNSVVAHCGIFKIGLLSTQYANDNKNIKNRSWRAEGVITQSWYLYNGTTGVSLEFTIYHFVYGDRKSIEQHFEDAVNMRSVLPTDTSALTCPALVKV